jgi:hypothetical protein
VYLLTGYVSDWSHCIYFAIWRSRLKTFGDLCEKNPIGNRDPISHFHAKSEFASPPWGPRLIKPGLDAIAQLAKKRRICHVPGENLNCKCARNMQKKNLIKKLEWGSGVGGEIPHPE